MTDHNATPDDPGNDDAILRAMGKRERDRRSRAALRPLSDDFQARMTRQIKADLAAAKTDQESADHDAGDHAEPGPSYGGNVRTFPATRRPRVRRGWMVALAASVLAAVGIATNLSLDGGGSGLPDYALEFDGGAVVRSDGNAAAPLQVGDTLRAVLRPEQTVDRDVQVIVLRDTGDALERVPADVDLAASGAARVRVTLAPALDLVPGPQSWWFVIRAGSDTTLPRSATALAAGATNGDWTALPLEFELVP